MIITGPENLLGLTSKEATDSFVMQAKKYLRYLNQFNCYSIDILKLEEFIQKTYKIKNRSIYSLFNEALDRINLILDGDNRFKISIPDIALKDTKLTCDNLFRLTIYGNREVKGTNLVDLIFKHSLRYI